jgi:kumamolisin
VKGGYHDGPQGEATLDVETISGLAPGANIDVYEAPNFANANIIASLNAVVDQHKVSSVSNSWGEGENLVPANILKSSDNIFKQAVAKGIEEIFSSGDSGAEGDYRQNGSYAVVADWPACDPYVTALGGVHITVNGTTGAIESTTATWLNLKDRNGYADASGGGISAVYALPSYQSQIAIKTTGRNVPDLALPGDQEDANYAASFGGWYSQGGTSWSGPAFNAMLADVESGLGTTTGFVNPTLYAAYGTGGASFVGDVTTGANGIFGHFGYSAGPNYDLTTGMGTPIGSALLSIL